MRQTCLLRQLQLSVVRASTQITDVVLIEHACSQAATASHQVPCSMLASHPGAWPASQHQPQALSSCLPHPAWPLRHATPCTSLLLAHAPLPQAAAHPWQQQQRPFSSKKGKKGKKGNGSKQLPRTPQQQQPQPKPAAKRRWERPKHIESLQDNEEFRAIVRKRHEIRAEAVTKQQRQQMCQGGPGLQPCS